MFRAGRLVSCRHFFSPGEGQGRVVPCRHFFVRLARGRQPSGTLTGTARLMLAACRARAVLYSRNLCLQVAQEAAQNILQNATVAVVGNFHF